MSLLAVFISGLLSGGLTCFAVQGGLLGTLLAQSKNQENVLSPLKQTIAFLSSRLVGYTVLGFLLGSLGAVFQLSLQLRAGIQIAVAVFMIGTALNLLQAHPLFRYFVIKPPKVFMKYARNQSQSQALFAPGLLGVSTVFIPCGATQAMMAYALTTGTGLQGALVMAIFIIGTSPLFLALGLATTKISSNLSTRLTPYVSAAIIMIAIYNLIGGFSLSGNQVAARLLSQAHCLVTVCTPDASVSSDDVSTEATIVFHTNGYQITSGQSIAAGSKVKLNLVNQEGQGCIQAFTIPELNIERVVRAGQTQTLEFTAPSQPGNLTFMCSMGMYQGQLMVV